MANPEHVERLRDVDAWNQWRSEHTDGRPDLSEANLTQADLLGADLTKADLAAAKLTKANLTKSDLAGAKLIKAKLSGANLTRANLFWADLPGAKLIGAKLSGAKLSGADLSGADLSGANLFEANLRGANLFEADLTVANLTGADLSGADLSGADLSGVNLSGASLVRSVLDAATLNGARVYGTSVWDLVGTPKSQQDLIITPTGGADVTVDNLKVAQFIYLLSSNEEIRDVIDTITSKAVLILGRFTPERKPVLDTVRTLLREQYNYSPIMFNFEKPANKTVADTVRLLASMVRFVVVDLTEATSANLEVGMITNPGLRRPPISFMIERGRPTTAMPSTDVLDYPEIVDPVHQYDDLSNLADTLVDGVLDPAEKLWHILNS